MTSYRYTHIRQGDESSAEQTSFPSTGGAGVYCDGRSTDFDEEQLPIQEVVRQLQFSRKSPLTPSI